MARRALLLVNCKARRGAECRDTVATRLRNLDFDLVEPRADEMPAEAIRAQAAGVDLIVIGGGDGTLNAAADALAECGKPVGVIPLGTANDLARTLNIPTDLDAACKLI